MRQVFFITDDRMTAMLWQGSQLISKYEFSDNGNDALSQYLEKSKNIVSSIVLDVLEEEITLASIPHVHAHERKFLIERTLTRLHRGVEFSTANIIGRDTSKRRDDRLLVSGMTSSRPLLRWLDIINEHDVLLKGIYSLPLISGSVLKVLKIKKGLTLLVSRQSKNFIRQSIFKNGKLFYSRNIPSSENLDVSIFSEDLQKTRKYLENQKLLTTGDSVDVLVLSSQRFYSQLEGLDDLLTGMNISYVQYDDLKKTIGIKSEFNIAGQEIFSSLLLGSMTKNHYARESDSEGYKKKVKEKLINISSVAIAVALILVTFKFYLDIDVLDYKVEGVNEQVNVLKEHNDRLEKNLTKLPVKAKEMKLFVDNVTDIQRVSEHDIRLSMVEISQVFNTYNNISLVSLDWSINATERKVSSQRRKQRTNRKALKNKKGQVVDLVATVDFSALTNQNASKVIEKFLLSMRNLKLVQQVTVTKKAIRASSSDTMRGVISEKNKNKSEISLTLIMKDQKNES